MKYQSDLCSINDCPPLTSERVQRQAYRFVFNPICEKSFIPQGIKKPQRVSGSTNDVERCSLLGLSMFDSDTKAITRYKYLKGLMRNIEKTIGTHLAQGKIRSTDGLVTKPNNQGHYDLFEFKNVNLSPNFQIIVDLRGI